MLAVAPGPHRFLAEVESEQGIKRTITRDIFVRGRPRPRAGRLRVLTLAPAFREPLIPPIKFAERDARDLKIFLTKYLVSPRVGGPLVPFGDVALDGASATVERVRQSFEALGREAFDEGDLVVVVIESHFLNNGRERKIVAADGHSVPPEPTIPADEVARALGEVAKYKCGVLVLLDGVHTRSNKVWDTDVTEWVRYLRDEQNVITFVASNNGPSQQVDDRGHRAFAQAVLDSVRPPLLRDGPYSLNEFRDRVVEGVLNLTGRQQQAACYVPAGISGQFPILDVRPGGR